MTDKCGVQGQFEIYVNGKLDKKIKNTIMDTVLDQFIEVYQAQSVDLEIKYLALGTSATTVTNTDTQLGSEIFRTPITEQIKAATGTLRTEFVILDTEGVGLIEEIGLFGGSTATSSADTGTLISRILWSKNKTSNEELNIIRTDTIIRA